MPRFIVICMKAVRNKSINKTKITLNIARTADEAARQASGEDLTTADAIYGEDEDKFESLADFEDEDDDRLHGHERPVVIGGKR